MKSVYFIGVLIFVTCATGDDAIPELPQPCNMICTLIYSPVCAGNGRDPPETFGNKCFLEGYNCFAPEDEKLDVIYPGECTELGKRISASNATGDNAFLKRLLPCNFMCTLEYAPVCAGNGRDPPKTFGNRCFFEGFNCYAPESQKSEVLYPGVCKELGKRISAPNATGDVAAPKRFLPCYKPCTLEYKPVCAGNGRDPPGTFPNNCTLEGFNCFAPEDEKVNVIYNGECKEIRKRSAPERTCEPCPTLSQPICGGSNSGLGTYENACLMEQENCQNQYHGGSRLRFVHAGPCTGDEVVEQWDSQH